MGWSKALVGATVAAALSLIHHGAIAQDHLKLAVGARGVGEDLRAGAGPERRHLQEARPRARHFLHARRRRDASRSSFPTPPTSAVAIGFLGTIGAFAKGAPVRIIGSNFTGGKQLFWYVRADSPIKSLKDAAGKTVAYSTNGSSTHTRCWR